MVLFPQKALPGLHLVTGGPAVAGVDEVCVRHSSLAHYSDAEAAGEDVPEVPGALAVLFGAAAAESVAAAFVPLSAFEPASAPLSDAAAASDEDDAVDECGEESSSLMPLR